jgi:acetyl esterase
MPLNPKYVDYLNSYDWDSVYDMGVDKIRETYQLMMAAGKGVVKEVGSVEDRTIKTSVRDTKIRIYNPKQKLTDGVIIWMHGGGFVLGDMEHGDSSCREFCSRIGCTVINIEYGLCPPFKFPDPQEECYEITKWVYEKAKELGVNPNKICLAGDSVGGTLTGSLCLMARDRQEFPIAFQMPIYACFDWLDIGERLSRRENGKGYRLTQYAHQWFLHFYLRDDVIVCGKNPYASPLLAKHFDRLPPALVITAEFDLLRDENHDYAQKLIDAGVEAEYVCYPGDIHGFLAFKQLGIESPEHCYELIRDRVTKVFSKIGIKT